MRNLFDPNPEVYIQRRYIPRRGDLTREHRETIAIFGVPARPAFLGSVSGAKSRGLITLFRQNISRIYDATLGSTYAIL